MGGFDFRASSERLWKENESLKTKRDALRGALKEILRCDGVTVRLDSLTRIQAEKALKEGL